VAEVEPLEPGASVDAAWTTAITDPLHARAAANLARKAILESKPSSPRGLPTPPTARVDSAIRRFALVDDGRRMAVSAVRQLVIVDAKTLAPLGSLRAFAYESLSPIPKTSLFLARTDGGGATIYDAGPLSLVIVLGQTKTAVSPDGSSVAVLEAQQAVWRWDVSRRALTWHFANGRSLNDVAFADDGSAVVLKQSGEPPVASVDAVAGTPLVEGIAQPAFSSDGHIIVNAVASQRGAAIQVIDRQTGLVKATSAACSSPTSFALDRAGKRLAVGSAQAMCFFELPSLRFRGRTELADSPKNAPDGWDRVVPTFVAGDRAVFARRRDGVAAVVDGATMKPTWVGRGQLVRIAEREVIDNGSCTVAEIDDTGHVAAHEATTDDLAEIARAEGIVTGRPNASLLKQLDRAVCSVGEWLLPGPCP